MDTNHNEMRIRSVLALGDELGCSDLATRVAKRGGNSEDLFRAYREREAVPSGDRVFGLGGIETGSYSLLNLIRAQADREPDRARHERDMSSLLMAKTGTVPVGDFVPFSVFARDFNVGTSSQAGNLVGDARIGALAGDPLRQIFTLNRLGATFVSGLKTTAAVPVFTSDESVNLETEVGAAPEVFHETSLVTLTPRRIAVVFEMSRQAVIQATPELETVARRLMAQAIDEAMQKQVLAGDGVVTGSDYSTDGILFSSDVNVTAGGTDGAAPTFANLVEMEYNAAASDVPVGARGWLFNAKTQKTLRTTARGSGLPYILGDDNQVLGAPAVVSNVMPSTLEKGSGSNLSAMMYSSNWTELLIGIYGAGIDVVVDRITLADQGQLRVVCSMLFGFGMRTPKAFSVMKDAICG